MMFNTARLYYNYGDKEKAKRILKRLQSGFLKEKVEEHINHAGIIL